ncbi:hypothetical protein [Nostoc sp. DedSLP04]|nr:hypothetical protein [Nostoc sp. DedSLP04]MDZ8031564.1 hypothetical protein [Nostoc sp. DedSLP04]
MNLALVELRYLTMTASVEYIPVTPIEYPDEDGKPMAEGDI